MIPARTLAAALLLGAAAPLAAQRPLVTLPLDSGAVVRLRLAGGGFETGKLLSGLGRDSTRLSCCRWPALPCTAGGDGHVSRSADSVAGLEVHAGTGVRTGALIGGLAGLAPSYLGNEIHEYSAERRMDEGQRLRTTAVTVGLCALFGGVVGAMRNHWAPAP